MTEQEIDTAASGAGWLLIFSGLLLAGLAYCAENYEAGWAVRVLAWLLLASPS
jgi:hypothetical protein